MWCSCGRQTRRSSEARGYEDSPQGVRHFQRNTHLPVTGTIGEQSALFLNSALLTKTAEDGQPPCSQ